MKVKVLKTIKLVDLVNEENIVSVVQRTNRTGNSLAIAIKEGSPVENLQHGIYFKKYGGTSSEGGRCMFISTDKYSYNIPSYISLPKNFYRHVNIIVKYDEEHDIRFIRCRITRKVIW